MRFFARKRDQARPEPNKLVKITMSGRDYGQLSECDAPLKFWLSEPIEKKIDEMCSFQDTCASDIIRQILFIHLYGRYDLFGLVERQVSTYKLNPVPQIRYSRCRPIRDESNDPPPQPRKPIEKNIADVKVWIPAKMKEDLHQLADQAGFKLSQYVRTVITTHLLGHIPHDNAIGAAVPPADTEDN